MPITTSGTAITFNDATVQTTAFTGASGIGVGQTWQSVTRSAGVTYTNSTGKPIGFIMTFAAGAGSNDYVYLTIGGVSVFFIGAVLVSGVVFGQNMAIIPPGLTYSYTADRGSTSKNVYELR
jgi:hypothetical protein